MMEANMIDGNLPTSFENNDDVNMLNTLELVVGRYKNELNRLIDLPVVNPSVTLLAISLVEDSITKYKNTLNSYLNSTGSEISEEEYNSKVDALLSTEIQIKGFIDSLFVKYLNQWSRGDN